MAVNGVSRHHPRPLPGHGGRERHDHLGIRVAGGYAIVTQVDMYFGVGAKLKVSTERAVAIEWTRYTDIKGPSSRIPGVTYDFGNVDVLGLTLFCHF